MLKAPAAQWCKDDDLVSRSNIVKEYESIYEIYNLIQINELITIEVENNSSEFWCSLIVRVYFFEFSEELRIWKRF